MSHALSEAGLVMFTSGIMLVVLTSAFLMWKEMESTWQVDATAHVGATY